MDIRLWAEKKYLFFLFISFLFVSCSSTVTYVAPKNFPLKEPVLAEGKAPIRIGLYLQTEICQYEFYKKRRNAKLHYQIGEALCDGISRMMNMIFKEVIIFESVESQDMIQGLKAIIIPEVVTSSILLPVMKTQELEILLRVKFSAMDINRKLIWEDTFQGESRIKWRKVSTLSYLGGPLLIIRDASKKEKEDMVSGLKLAIEDLLYNAQEGITISKWWQHIE